MLIIRNKKYSNDSDYILDLIWKFRWLTKQNIYNLSYLFNLMPQKIDDIIKNLESRKLITTDDSDLAKVYLITNEGCKKIKRKYIPTFFSFSRLVHNSYLYKLMKIKKWNKFLSEREIIAQISFKQIKTKKYTIPDLIIRENKKIIAIELERSNKGSGRYKIILNKHVLQIDNFYDKVYYFATENVFNSVNKVIQKIKANNINNIEIEKKYYKKEVPKIIREIWNDELKFEKIKVFLLECILKRDKYEG